MEGGSTGFAGLRFLHDALPELSEREVDPGSVFLGCRTALPLLISCMTGGSAAGFAANKDLARAAQEAKVPVGLGSSRVLFDHPELFEHFHVKPLAPDVPVLANLGFAQVRDRDHRTIFELVRRLEAQALVIHLNPGQELFQPEGDRDFRGLREALRRLLEDAPLPVIVKETGCGMRPSLVRWLLDSGAAYVDLAGSGGTNWITVEAHRLEEASERQAAEAFRDWGIPTGVLLGALQGAPRLIASGGVRDGLDVARAVALGAEAAGMALPFIRAVTAGGVEAVAGQIRVVERVLRGVMLLTGARTVAELRRGRLWADPAFSAAVESLRRADAGR